jgi:acyl-CoA dehydrogenase
MWNLIPLLVLFGIGAVCAFHRVRLLAWTGVSLAAQLLMWISGQFNSTFMATLWVLLGAVALLLNFRPLRMALVSSPFLAFYKRIAPQLSETEKVALEAGTVGFEGELFSGNPDWQKLLSQKIPTLTAEEQAFMDGPVEQLCRMTNDWEITHRDADLPPAMWDFIKKNRFFGMIIPKSYGGLEFSAFAHSAVVQKVSTMSATVGTTICVPNSLGPGELLMHYGTDEQKNYYLPRLADGREIPCFGLTNPYAGSDATSIPDTGVVCKQMHEGKEVLGLRLTFDKRYITLAPVATIVGIAFRMLDPDHLIGDKIDIGISLVLVPRDTPGLDIGRRHNPLNCAFQNGPIRAKDLFVPLNQLIGGEKYAGQGWKMLVECLSVGRAISLPSGATGAARMAALATGAYARIRKQFGMSIGRFEGVEEALARIGGYAYAVSALSRMSASVVDLGEKPAVPSAIAKYHATEMSRIVISDAMDVHGGKGVILGPRNYLGRAWQANPIFITVEGANILTRNMIIFGQGAIRCHPFILREMQAAANPDAKAALNEFDHALFGHIGFAVGNAMRTLWYGLTLAYVGSAPGDDYTKRFYRKLNRYSAALALLADISMLSLGGKLKFKERLSARLGDVLSQLYISSAILKRFEDQGRPTIDRPFLAWSLFDSTFKMQTALVGALRNFPIRPIAWVLGWMMFPLGQRDRAPGDRTGHKVAALLMSPNEARDRLGEFCHTAAHENSPVGRMLQTLPDVIAAEPIERKLEKARKAGPLGKLEGAALLEEAVKQGVISELEKALLDRVRLEVFEVISTDDFAPEELRASATQSPRDAQRYAA